MKILVLLCAYINSLEFNYIAEIFSVKSMRLQYILNKKRSTSVVLRNHKNEDEFITI